MPQRRAVAEADAMGDLRQVGEHRRQRFDEAALDDQGDHAGGAHQLEHLQRRQAVVERQADQPAFGQGEIGLDHFRTVAAEECHPVTLAQAEAGEAMGQAVAAFVGLAEGEAALGGGAEEAFPLGEADGGGAENLADHHFAHGMTFHRGSPG
ncbi:hypothetical protein D3C81_1173850 [compost metagenome]